MILQPDLTFLDLRMPQPTKHAVMIIGGAEDKIQGKQILQTFFQRSGGEDSRIAIVPCASREPAIIGNRYETIFSEMGAKAIEVIDIQDRAQGEDPAWLGYVERCTGIFLTGGDQLRLCGLLADTPIMEIVRKRAQLGALTLAGTSAGAAVMGLQMIAGGGSGEPPNRALVDMTLGLGIVPEVIVDQHFHNRNRMARLMSAVASHPDRLGIGIDEDTCALFESGGVFQVIGKGTVTVVDPAEALFASFPTVGSTDPISIHNLRVHILSHGDRYDFHHRRVMAIDN
ncbi:MAG: cyanophycinase [Leptolyngbyaceae cyanobacterium CSU_1_4]|nr:cyanophycinase [Leptolyngbyaceae cyanobacterium CSU_1_4]